MPAGGRDGPRWHRSADSVSAGLRGRGERANMDVVLKSRGTSARTSPLPATRYPLCAGKLTKTIFTLQFRRNDEKRSLNAVFGRRPKVRSIGHVLSATSGRPHFWALVHMRIIGLNIRGAGDRVLVRGAHGFKRGRWKG